MTQFPRHMCPPSTKMSEICSTQRLNRPTQYGHNQPTGPNIIQLLKYILSHSSNISQIPILVSYSTLKSLKNYPGAWDHFHCPCLLCSGRIQPIGTQHHSFKNHTNVSRIFTYTIFQLHKCSLHTQQIQKITICFQYEPCTLSREKHAKINFKNQLVPTRKS